MWTDDYKTFMPAVQIHKTVSIIHQEASAREEFESIIFQ